MQDARPTEVMQEEGLESPPPSLNSSYSITLTASPTGYTVTKTHAHPVPQDADTEPHLPDITSALKAVLAMVRENPIGMDEQEAFRATSPIGED